MPRGRAGTAIALSLFGLVAVQAQVPPPAPGSIFTLTLDQAVGEAIDHNLNLAAERFNVTVAGAAVLGASLRPNTVVTAN